MLCTGAIYTFNVSTGTLCIEKIWSMSNFMVAVGINSAVGPIPMILSGFEQGLAYLGCLSNKIKFFKEKRGFALGTIIADIIGQ